MDKTISARDRWNQEYESGAWKRLQDPEEGAHYSALAELMVRTKRNRRILDVGCGEGLLLDFIGPYGYEQYLGIDISDIALNAAARRVNWKTFFINASAESFMHSDRFDAVVFNECLSYFSDPIKLISRYSELCAVDGMIFISQFISTLSDKSIIDAGIARVQDLYPVEDIVVTNDKGTWRCCALKGRLTAARSYGEPQ